MNAIILIDELLRKNYSLRKKKSEILRKLKKNFQIGKNLFDENNSFSFFFFKIFSKNQIGIFFF